eukprot:c27218_g1_i1 orf=154-2214(+)
MVFSSVLIPERSLCLSVRHIWTTSQTNCGGAAGRINSGRMVVHSEQANDNASVSDDDSFQECFVLHHGLTKGDNVVDSAVHCSPNKTGRRNRMAQVENRPFPDIPLCLKEEPPQCGAWRMEAFENVWTKLEKHIQDAMHDEITKSFQEIQDFVHDTQFSDAQLKLYLAAKAVSLNHENRTGLHTTGAVTNRQLHTAVIFLGNLDSSDHKETFKDLATYLKQQQYHVASLLPHFFSSKSGIAGPLRSLLKQIVQGNSDMTDMNILVSWHRQPTNEGHPLVIIIENAEQCNSAVLSDFLSVLSEWITELPLVLIMGMATTTDALRNLLPASGLRLLHVKKFTLQCPYDYLKNIIRAVLLEPLNGFYFGFEVMKFFLSRFRSHDTTITSFLRALKMACMEHFCSQPLSFLCKNVSQLFDQEKLEAFCMSLPRVLLEYASSLPSVKRDCVTEQCVGRDMALALSKLSSHLQNQSIALKCLFEEGNQLGVDSIEILDEVLHLQSLNATTYQHNAELLVDAFQSKGHKICGSITAKMRQYLVPVESLPFHEIICFKDVTVIKQALVAETQKKTQMDLLNADANLMYKSCRQQDSGSSSSIHDSCLMYRLAQKYGDHVNVYDLYESFTTVSHSELPIKKERKQGNPKKRIRRDLMLMDRAFIQYPSTINLCLFSLLVLDFLPSLLEVTFGFQT